MNRMNASKALYRLTWTSTALAVIVAVAWVASSRWYVAYLTGGYWYIMIGGGELVVESFDKPRPAELAVGDVYHFELGFSIDQWSRRRYHVPLWLPALLLFITSILFWRMGRRRNASVVVTCVHCDYDQAGIEASSKCPECGALQDRRTDTSTGTSTATTI